MTLTLPAHIEAGHVRFARDLADQAAAYATTPSGRGADSPAVGAGTLGTELGAFVTGVDGAKVVAGKVAKERSRCDVFLSRLVEAIDPVRGFASGLTGKARRGKSHAAGDRIRSECRANECRATQAERERQSREGGKH